MGEFSKGSKGSKRGQKGSKKGQKRRFGSKKGPRARAAGSVLPLGVFINLKIAMCTFLTLPWFLVFSTKTIVFGVSGVSSLGPSDKTSSIDWTKSNPN
jgi:hypothetical protein